MFVAFKNMIQTPKVLNYSEIEKDTKIVASIKIQLRHTCNFYSDTSDSLREGLSVSFLHNGQLTIKHVRYDWEKSRVMHILFAFLASATKALITQVSVEKSTRFMALHWWHLLEISLELLEKKLRGLLNMNKLLLAPLPFSGNALLLHLHCSSCCRGENSICPLTS